jgi:hypothetical protein
VRLEGLGKLIKSNDLGNQTRHLPVCGIVPQPTTLPADRYLTALIQLCLVSVLIASNDRNANVGRDEGRSTHA